MLLGAADLGHFPWDIAKKRKRVFASLRPLGKIICKTTASMHRHREDKKMFKEIKLEQTRELNDGVKAATLMSVSGACGATKGVVIIRPATPTVTPSRIVNLCSWSTNACRPVTGFCQAGKGCQK
jgi:hypothetical protein